MDYVPEGSLTDKLVYNNVKLQADLVSTFRFIQEKLSKIELEFHSFSLRENRSLIVLLLGIPSSVSEDKVKKELSSLGFEPKFIRQFFKEGRKLPMFMISLPNNPENKNIFNLHALFFMAIRVVPYRTLGSAQYHSSAHCSHTTHCVKCGDNHLIKVCTKTAELL